MSERDLPPGEPTRPLVSVVTVVLNGAATLERTIRSVLDQTYRPIEYIVVDGGSSDGTLALIQAYAPHLACWISEPDGGISEAFNRGIRLATGDYVALLNADDWMDPSHIAKGVHALARSPAGFVFGDLRCASEQGGPSHRVPGDAHYRRWLRHHMPDVNHPSMLVRRSAYEVVGLFDARYRVAMDYDWVLRADQAGVAGEYVPGLRVHMSLGGVSDRSFPKALREVRDISIRHGYPRAYAQARFAYRLAKGFGRRLAERHLPYAVHARLRQMVNGRHFHPIG
jgi:glycosyltransferase involved in cell wall biosynthesis